MSSDYVGRAGVDAGDSEIRMSSEYTGRAGADDAGEDKIEMPPKYVGRTVETPYGIGARFARRNAAHGEQEPADSAYKKLVDDLHERYPKEIAEDGVVQLMEVDLFVRHNELSRWLRGRNPEKLSPAEQEIYDKLVTGTHEVEQERDAYIKEFYEEKFQEEG